MSIPASQLHNVPIVSLQAGEPIAILDQPIITPNNLHVVAYTCKSYNGHQDSLVLAQDIRQLSAEFAIVNDEEDILGLTDIVRLREAVSHPYRLTGKAVATETGQQLGIVRDFAIQLDGSFVRSLFIGPRLFGSRQFGHGHIDRNQIIDITPTKIIVQDAAVRESAGPAMIPDAAA